MPVVFAALLITPVAFAASLITPTLNTPTQRHCQPGRSPPAILSLDSGFRFCPDPAERAAPLAEIAEFEALALALPRFYNGQESPQQYKRTLLAAADAIATRAGGPERVAANMTEPQLQRAFVVLSFLVHYYVWCEDGAAEQVLPRTIAAPYWHVAKALGCEPVYTDAVIMWNMVGAGGDSTADPDLIHLEFSWTQTESERWFSVIQGAVLRLLDPLMGRALLLREEILPQYTGGEGPDTAVDPAHARAAADFCDDLASRLDDARLVMGRMFERLDPHDFLVFRRYFEGWQSSSEFSRSHLPTGLTFSGVEGTADALTSVVLGGIPGANAGQQGSWHVLDAILGLTHEEPFLREQRRLMPASQRRFVERFTAEPAVSLRAFFDAHPALDRAPYTRAVASLRAWRREHISLAGMYLVSFARELEGDPARGPPRKSPLHVKGTGGSEAKGGKAKGGFVKLLQSYIRETVDPRAVKEARPSGGGSEMACPLTSAKQYLRGPKFTRQQYDEARRARARPDKEGALVRAWSGGGDHGPEGDELGI